MLREGGHLVNSAARPLWNVPCQASANRAHTRHTPPLLRELPIADH